MRALLAAPLLALLLLALAQQPGGMTLVGGSGAGAAGRPEASGRGGQPHSPAAAALERGLARRPFKSEDERAAKPATDDSKPHVAGHSAKPPVPPPKPDAAPDPKPAPTPPPEKGGSPEPEAKGPSTPDPKPAPTPAPGSAKQPSPKKAPSPTPKPAPTRWNPKPAPSPDNAERELL